MRGVKHTVESFKEKYYNKFPDSKLEILEILPKEKVRCKTKYSEHIVEFRSIFFGHIPMINTSTNKTEYFINRAKEVHGELYDYSLVEYNSKKVVILCKEHGEFLQRPSKHLYGGKCMKCRNKNIGNLNRSTTEQFVEKANKIHNFKYNYSKVNYINSVTSVTIICPIHGDFEQIPNSHLNGRSCKLCANLTLAQHNKNNPTSWNYTNWEKAGSKSKHFDSFKIYIIKCWNEEEEFYKIGKTYNTVKRRFKSKIKMPYNYEIIETIVGESREISTLEKELQKLNYEFKYETKILFKGNNECFSKIINN